MFLKIPKNKLYYIKLKNPTIKVKPLFFGNRGNILFKMKMCRYELAIKQGLNKHFNNKSSLNKTIAALIVEYSHQSVLTAGTQLVSGDRWWVEFFVIRKMFGPNWCEGCFCPLQREYDNYGIQQLRPFADMRRKSRIYRKRIFDPFGRATIKKRAKRFQFIENEQVPNFLHLLA